jgi:uncharacterized protein (TIGR03437 family)
MAASLGLRRLALLVLLCGTAAAAPILQLSNSAVVWPSGSTAPQSICAYNLGDGTLSLTASVRSGAGWLSVSVSSTQCIQFTVDPSGLAQGTYTAEVTISDPHAVDAPQMVTATILVDGGDPVNVYVTPGSQTQIPLAGGCEQGSAATQDGGKWLSVEEVIQNQGTFGFPIYVCVGLEILLAPPTSMAVGTYPGVVTVSGFGSAYTLPVTMHLTTLPIAVPSVTRIDLRLAQGGPAMAYPFLPAISFTNSGLGALQVQNVSAAGVGVSAYQYGQLAIVTVDPASRGPGTYTDGVVTIQCNGANCPLRIPVSLEIDSPGAPTIDYQGVVDNATFVPNAVAPGDVCLVRGRQLTSSGPTSAPGVPLPGNLGGTTVIVDGLVAPVYYVSPGQIAFQMPYNLLPGTALVQVANNGLASNTVSVYVVASAPQLLVATDAAYNLRDATHPTHAGETLILWAIGLGATNPPVDAGESAPKDPPAAAAVVPQAIFAMAGDTVGWATPSFAGLSGGSAGLYQVTVTVPASVPKGVASVLLTIPGWYTNSLPLLVQ